MLEFKQLKGVKAHAYVRHLLTCQCKHRPFYMFKIVVHTFLAPAAAIRRDDEDAALFDRIADTSLVKLPCGTNATAHVAPASRAVTHNACTI
jgi:hypothetical protein